MKKQSWLVIEGEAKISKGELKFTAPKEAVDLDRDRWPLSVLRSNIYFSSGEITCLVRIKKKGDIFHAYLGESSIGPLYVGLNFKHHAYGIAAVTQSGPEYLSVSGKGIHPMTNEWIELRIKYIGSHLELFVNGISVAETNIKTQREQLLFRLRGAGEVTVKNIEFLDLNPQAFVVMQFSDEYNALYTDVIKPACEQYNYEVVRADDMYTTGLIIEDITTSIRNSALVIADITPNNPNVYYEVGYAHGIGKPTILLSDKNREKLPFDISGFRLLFYNNTIGGKASVEETLKKHLESI